MTDKAEVCLGAIGKVSYRRIRVIALIEHVVANSQADPILARYTCAALQRLDLNESVKKITFRAFRDFPYVLLRNSRSLGQEMKFGVHTYLSTAPPILDINRLTTTNKPKMGTSLLG